MSTPWKNIEERWSDLEFAIKDLQGVAAHARRKPTIRNLNLALLAYKNVGEELIMLINSDRRRLRPKGKAV